AQALERQPPDHGVEAGAGVLQREIAVPGAGRALETGNLAAHPDVLEVLLNRTPQGEGELGDSELDDIGGELVYRLKERSGHSAATCPVRVGRRATSSPAFVSAMRIS